MPRVLQRLLSPTSGSACRIFFSLLSLAPEGHDVSPLLAQLHHPIWFRARAGRVIFRLHAACQLVSYTLHNWPLQGQKNWSEGLNLGGGGEMLMLAVSVSGLSSLTCTVLVVIWM